MMITKDKEKVLNIPNLITFSRIILTFFIIYLVFTEANIGYIIFLFVLAMLTDVFDGFAARRLNSKTEFGRNFDAVADKILMLFVVLAVVIKFSQSGLFQGIHYIQIIVILFREILTLPLAAAALFLRAGIPKGRTIGKVTTVMQVATFPLILLSVFYEFFFFSVYFSAATGVAGIFSAFRYTKDIRDLIRFKKIKD